MSYIELYKSRLSSNGGSVSEQKMDDSRREFENSLSDILFSEEVEVNGVMVRVLINATTKYNERRILMKHDDIAWGDLLKLENDLWLVLDRPYFNKIHDKSKIMLCTQDMVFTTQTDGVYEYDRMGNKVWIEEPTTITIEFPCAVESISELNLKTTTGASVNIPEGDMVLHIQNTDDKLIHIGNNFKLFGDTYRISGIDKSRILGDTGVITMIASRNIE